MSPTPEPTVSLVTRALTPFGPDAAASTTPNPRAASITFTFDAPASWAQFEEIGVWIDGNGPPDGADLMFYRGSGLFSDPCLTEEEAEAAADIPVGPTVDDLVTALVDHPSLDVTSPVDVTLAGFSGNVPGPPDPGRHQCVRLLQAHGRAPLRSGPRPALAHVGARRRRRPGAGRDERFRRNIRPTVGGGAGDDRFTRDQARSSAGCSIRTAPVRACPAGALLAAVSGSADKPSVPLRTRRPDALHGLAPSRESRVMASCRRWVMRRTRCRLLAGWRPAPPLLPCDAPRCRRRATGRAPPAPRRPRHGEPRHRRPDRDDGRARRSPRRSSSRTASWPRSAPGTRCWRSPATRRRSSTSARTSPTRGSSMPTPTGSGTATTTDSRRRPRPWMRPSAAAGPRSPSSGSTMSGSTSSRQLAADDALPLRVDAYLALNEPNRRRPLRRLVRRPRTGPVTDRLRVRGLKITLDNGLELTSYWEPDELTETIAPRRTRPAGRSPSTPSAPRPRRWSSTPSRRRSARPGRTRSITGSSTPSR